MTKDVKSVDRGPWTVDGDDVATAAPDPEEVKREAEERVFFASSGASRLTPHSSPLTRTDGWERRYQAVLDHAAREPYVLGSHDCFRVACAVLEALTGVDRWPEFAGRYKTRRESLVLLREYAEKATVHGPRLSATPDSHVVSTFDDAMSWFFGIEPCAASYARRGDVVKVVDLNGTAHLGICTGRRIEVLRETGLMPIALSHGVCCWRIG